MPGRAQVVIPIVRAVIATLVTATVLFPAVPVSAQTQNVPIDAPGWSATVSTNAWWSFGGSKWEFDPIFVPIGSKLNWKDVESPVVMVTGDLAWRYLVLSAGFGWGQVIDGTFVDEDFVKTPQGNVLFSQTTSDVPDGHILLFNADVGLRPVRYRDSYGRLGFIDLLVGYQYWREEYEAFGNVPQIDPFALSGARIPSNVRTISHEWKWQSLRVGGRFDAPIWRDLNFRLSAFFLPWSSLEVRDTHHLRPDLAQNPSVITTAKGGFGYQLDTSLTYTFFYGLAVEAGFRYWRVDVHDGDVKFRFSDGTIAGANLAEASTKRFGPYVGLTYRF